MYITTKGRIVGDFENYIADNGTNYPYNVPKDGIESLLKITEVPKPDITTYQVASYVIDETNTQVWSIRDMTEEERYLKRKSLVPYSVTMRQARLVLSLHGYLGIIESTVAGMSEAAQIEWNFSKDVLRNQPLVLLLANLLELSEEDLDNLFIQAKTL